MITEVLDRLQNSTGLPIHALHSNVTGNNKVYPCLVYTYYLQDDNGARARWRLELNLITETVEEAEIYRQEINDIITTGDGAGEYEHITSLKLNGGGQMFNYETMTLHTYMYYDVYERSL